MDLVLSIAFVALLAIVVYVHKETSNLKKKFGTSQEANALRTTRHNLTVKPDAPKELDRCVTQIGRRF